MTIDVEDVHKDLLAFQAKTEQRFDQVDSKLDKVDGRLDKVDIGVRGLRADMPAIVGDAVREVLTEQRNKPRDKS